MKFKRKKINELPWEDYTVNGNLRNKKYLKIAIILLVLIGAMLLLIPIKSVSETHENIRGKANAEMFVEPGGNEVLEAVFDPCSLSCVSCSGVVNSHLARITAYTSTVAQTDQTPCISASGANICELKASGVNVCAANGYDFNTIIEIEGLGECVILDRMNSRYDKFHVDWYFGQDTEKAIEYGVKTKQVIVHK